MPEPVFSEYGLSGGEYDVLAALRRAGSPFRLTPSTLSQSLIVTSGGMTKRLKALEEAGLVRRVPSPTDRRSNRVQLTSRGRKLVESIVSAHVANEERLLMGLDERQRHDRAALLRRYLIALGDVTRQPRERATSTTSSHPREDRPS
jgi:DNA-binding MarR family transcriptional regulator